MYPVRVAVSIAVTTTSSRCRSADRLDCGSSVDQDRDEPDKSSLNIVAVLSWLLGARLTGPSQATGSYPCVVSISAIFAFPLSDGCVSPPPAARPRPWIRGSVEGVVDVRPPESVLLSRWHSIVFHSSWKAIVFRAWADVRSAFGPTDPVVVSVDRFSTVGLPARGRGYLLEEGVELWLGIWRPRLAHAGVSLDQSGSASSFPVTAPPQGRRR